MINVSNAETVQAIYEAFGRGDVPTMLEKLDDAVEWETTQPARLSSTTTLRIPPRYSGRPMERDHCWGLPHKVSDRKRASGNRSYPACLW
jgi:ketosteroid isomerase-like protein